MNITLTQNQPDPRYAGPTTESVLVDGTTVAEVWRSDLREWTVSMTCGTYRVASREAAIEMVAAQLLADHVIA